MRLSTTHGVKAEKNRLSSQIRSRFQSDVPLCMKPSEFSDNSARWSECSFCGKTQLDSFSHFHSLWACDGKTGTEAPIHHSIALCVMRCCTCDKHGQRGPQSHRQQRCGVLVTRATSDFMVHHRESAATHASRIVVHIKYGSACPGV